MAQMIGLRTQFEHQRKGYICGKKSLRAERSGGVAVGYDGAVNVTTGTVFGPGAGTVERIRP